MPESKIITGKPCIICGNNQGNQHFTIKELQLGMGDEFVYQLCSNCGSMQIADLPTDLSKYYPNDNYYSFNFGLKIRKKADWLRKVKADYLIHGNWNVAGALLSIGYKMPDYYEWMKKSATGYHDKILDVGTGNGGLLTKLYQNGYTDLTGIDPFINENADYGAIKIWKKDIFQLEGQFDLIMMHHSLEHMPEPLDALRQAYKLLKPGKCLLVRIPVMGNYGWQKYGAYWCGIDAPRHIFIPSEKGLCLFAKQAGFEVRKFEYDSSDYVIWSSEQYLKGIPLHAPNSRMMNRKKNTFTKEEIVEFKKIIHKENVTNNGDTAALYLYKPQ